MNVEILITYTLHRSYLHTRSAMWALCVPSLREATRWPHRRAKGNFKETTGAECFHWLNIVWYGLYGLMIVTSMLAGLAWFVVVGIVVILAHGFTFECHAFEGFFTMNYDEHDEFRGGGGPGKILPRSNPALLGLFLAAPPGICWKVAWNMLFLQWKVENAGKSTRKNQPKSRWLESRGIFRTMWLRIFQQVIRTS